MKRIKNDELHKLITELNLASIDAFRAVSSAQAAQKRITKITSQIMEWEKTE